MKTRKQRLTLRQTLSRMSITHYNTKNRTLADQTVESVKVAEQSAKEDKKEAEKGSFEGLREMVTQIEADGNRTYYSKVS